MVATLALSEQENDTGIYEYRTSEYGMHECGVTPSALVTPQDMDTISKTSRTQSED